jgi:uncharacterized protein (TIGR00369 family)
MQIATRERSGPFWDSIEGRRPLPPAAATLGLQLIRAEVDEGAIEVAFTATQAFTTPRGDILEGFLAAMLHDTVGPAVLATLEPDQFIVTLDLEATFLSPAYPGRIVGRGRVVYREGDLAFVTGELSDEHGSVVATATSTIRVTDSLADYEQGRRLARTEARRARI